VEGAQLLEDGFELAIDITSDNAARVSNRKIIPKEIDLHL
jgi:hypothetical protein